MGYDLEGHPYWQARDFSTQVEFMHLTMDLVKVYHADVLTGQDRSHTNSFPIPRRGHMLVAQGMGAGNTSRFWLFGGIGTVPTQTSPV